MAKNLEKLLKAIGIKDEEVENAVALLTSDETNEDSDNLHETILKATHAYADPFLKPKYKEEFDKERETLKGKYFQDAARQLNKAHENRLSEKEFKEAFEEGGYMTVVEKLQEIQEPGDPVNESEVKKALAKANARLEEMEEEHNKAIEAEKKRADSTINEFKTEARSIEELTALLKKKTNKPADKHARALFKMYNGSRALLRTNEDGEIEVMDPKSPENPLKAKGSDTKFVTLEMLADEYVEEFDLKAKAPPQPDPNNPNPADPEPPKKDEIKTSSSSMADFLAKNKDK